MKDKRNRTPALVKVMGAVVAFVVIWMFAMAYRAVSTGTKTAIVWDDLIGAEGPWTAIERFVDEHILGFSGEEIEGRPQDGPREEPANPFD